MIDDELAAFIRGSLRSVWALELLLLLQRDPARAWSVEALVGELRASRPLVAQVLGDFLAVGLIAEGPDGTVRFHPASQPLLQLCDALAAAYRQTPMAVTNLILSSRNHTLRALADAFRFRDT